MSICSVKFAESGIQYIGSRVPFIGGNFLLTFTKTVIQAVLSVYRSVIQTVTQAHVGRMVCAGQDMLAFSILPS